MEKEGNIGCAARSERGVRLLELLADEKQVCSVRSLARRTGLSRYKTMGLLAALESKGLVECAVQSGRYEVRGLTVLGRELLKSAGHPGETGPVLEPLVSRQDEAIYRSIAQDFRPVMEALARQHNEAMYLTVLAGDQVLFVDMVQCDGQVKGQTLVGKAFPFFCNAAGKVMRAIDSWDPLEKASKRWRRGRVRFPDLAGFRTELELIRERGVAVDCGGMGDGIITVAVAVRDYAGKVVGAVTMLGPSFRLLGERLEREIIPSLRLSGELLSMKFGYVRP